jgi:exodeoxyribonuclease VIII
MSKHIQLDLETLGVNPGCIVLSIGVVVFDFENTPGGEEQGEFHCHLGMYEQQKVGLTFDPNTLKFWLDADDEARKAIVKGQKEELTTVYIALAQLNEFLENVCGQDLEDVDHLDLKVWGNGANFDAPILREVYRRFGITCPWGWWNERCHRTIKNFYKDALGQTAHGWPSEPEREGTLHNALEDARHQANVLTYLHGMLYEQLHRKVRLEQENTPEDNTS